MEKIEKKKHHPVRCQTMHELRVMAVVAAILIVIWTVKGCFG